ncbi:MAG TPA: hypothetical protein EYG38_12175 [Verrucomicrobia bacterium]|nr:hypothetical protein [Verrucomicrobiota bacterium]
MKNLINNRTYQVAGAPDEAITGFEANPILLSALVPWRGKWDLAGGLEPVHIKPPENLDTVRRDFIKNQPYYAYNVDRKLGERARLATEALHLEFNTKFGDDLIAFPKVEEMLSEMRSFCDTLLEKADPNDADYPPVKEDPDSMNATLLPPICTGFPENIDTFQSDLAVFFNPKNGLELIPFFQDLISGMKKNGNGLTLEERDTIQLMVESTSVAPEFIDRRCKDHGPESVYASYGISSGQGPDFLKFILKCSKGIHYRNQQTLLQPEFLFLGNKDSLMP